MSFRLSLWVALRQIVLKRGGHSSGKVKTQQPLQIKSMNKHPILFHDENKDRGGRR